MSWHSHQPDEYEGELAHVSITRTTIVTRPAQNVDKRYRILVLLQRTDAPKYWTFKCSHCGSDVQEIANAEIEAMSDVVAIPGSDILLGRRCDGPYCRYYYYFKLNGVSK